MKMIRVAKRYVAAIMWAAICAALCGSFPRCFATDEPPHSVTGDHGPDLPPTGRSLFEHSVVKRRGDSVGYEIPFPIDALVRHLEKQAGCKPRTCARVVLIPLGRSLQRSAAAPDFFAYPRAVIAIDRESDRRGALRLKDRVYLGYQEKSAVIEVISYNEVAARFEFQLVKDYRANGSPRIINARRALCMACHQNQAPLFSRQQWDETNANAQVADRLAIARHRFYGFPIRIGISEPDAIDAAVHRANLFGLTRLLWRDGCGDGQPETQRCRAAALTAAVQFRLSGVRSFDSHSREFVDAVSSTLRRNLVRRWPAGLALPNPEIPNRDPFKFASTATGVEMTHVPAPLEPLAPRPPLEIVGGEDSQWPLRLVTGLNELLSSADMLELSQELSRRGTTAPRRQYRSKCAIDRGVAFRCADNSAGLLLEGRAVPGKSAVLDVLAVNGLEPLRDLDLARVQSSRRGTAVFGAVSTRLPDGNAIERLELNLDGAHKGEAVLTVREDFAPLRRALTGRDAGGDAGVTRRLAQVVASAGPKMRDLSGRFPPANVEVNFSDAPSQAAPFVQHCAVCHATPETFPPNFLYGDSVRISAALAACAPRIFVRLSMWQLDPAQRDKTPMPPVRSGATASPAAVAAMRDLMSSMLQTEAGVTPEVGALLNHGYEALRPCLPIPR